jgi:hypothetical protein
MNVDILFLELNIMIFIFVALVFTEELIKRPTFEIERILSFAGLGVDRWKLIGATMHISERLSAATRFSTKVPEELRRHGITVLQDELTKTKNLTEWPCLSFKLIDYKLPLSADLLSANCSDSFVHCSVPTDIRGG